MLLDSVLQAIYIAVNDFLQKRERESFRKKRVPRRKSVQRKVRSKLELAQAGLG